MFVCPSCAAMSGSQSPHGNGVPCPTELALKQAMVDEKVAHAELLRAQKDATIAGAGLSSRVRR